VKEISNCVICQNELKGSDFKVKDYLVSEESFSLLECYDCGLVHTSPVPPEKSLGDYYKSSEYFSHTDKPKSLLQKIYFFVRKIMINKKIKFINNYCQNGEKILDYGCGTGEFLAKCVKNGLKAKGLEPDDDARKIAENLLKIKIAHGFDELEESEKGIFNVITLWHVIEHVYDLNNTMEQLKNLLSNKGTLVLAVPNRDSYDAKFYKSEWGGFDVPRHLYHFNTKAINSLAKIHGFCVIKRRPLIFDSFFVSLLSEKQKYFPLRVLNAIIIGSLSNIRAFLGLNPYSSQVYFLQKE